MWHVVITEVAKAPAAWLAQEGYQLTNSAHEA